MTHSYACNSCFKIYALPNWVPPEVPCPLCFDVNEHSLSSTFWQTRRYQDEGPLDPDRYPHPRGVIGEIMANRLFSAGWLETKAHEWVRLGDDNRYDLESAFTAQFGSR